MSKELPRHARIILILSTLLVVFPGRTSGNKKTSQYLTGHIPGQITLGGLFPIHSRDKKGNCTVLNEVLGIQRLEAMIFAIRRINRDGVIMPGIELGMTAFDTCASETVALDRTVEGFITDPKCDSKEKTSIIGGRQVVGVVGPLYSSISVQLAHLLRLFKIPQISYDSTSSELSDKAKYEYFLRTAPSDFFQARAIVDVLKHFGWIYVSAVYSDDNYGRKGIEALTNEADRQGICIAVKEKISYPTTNASFSSTIGNLLAEKQARVVIVFCSKKESIQGLLHEAQKQNSVEQFQWIGSDVWVTVTGLTQLQPLVNGLISVRPRSKLTREFNEYLYGRLPSSNDASNPWFPQYFREKVRCVLLSDKSRTFPNCNSSHSLANTKLTIDSGVSRTIDAVYAFAHALAKIQRRYCNPGEICPEMEEGSGRELLSTLYKSEFTSINGERVRFNENGDAPAIYDIFYFNKSKDGKYVNTLIGMWENDLFVLPGARTNFQPRDSFCGTPCKHNEVKLRVDGKPSCCWQCAPCAGNKFAYNQTYCQTCPRGHWPHSGKDHCVPIPPRYFTLNTDYVPLYLALPPLIVAILGMIAVVMVMVIFIKYNETPLVKASGRELSFLLLTGLFLCYAVLVICFLKPSPYVCLLEFLLDSLPFTICYSAVIVKTNRISRIFNRRNLTKRPQFIHPQSQICFAFSLVAVQVMLLTAFCILQMPQAKLLNLSTSDVVLICAITDKDFLLSQIYNFVLIVVCTYYAFKTRRSPMNFNEAKYIAFAMYCTCVLWLAFITVYLVQTDVMLKSCIRCLSVSLIATIILVCLFVPKVYIIIFKPSENRKRPTLPSHSVSSLNGEQPPNRHHSTPQNESNTRDPTQGEGADQIDTTLTRRGLHRPRSSTDPRRYENERRSWRYSLPSEQFSQSTEPRRIEREEEMEIEMRALIERLAVLESLLNQQRQASGSYQTHEIQGAFKSCQGLIADVKRQSTCSIPECIEEGDYEEDVFESSNDKQGKPDNRSIIMAYAQAHGDKKPCKQHKSLNGATVSTAPFVSRVHSNDKEKIGLLDYPSSPGTRRPITEG